MWAKPKHALIINTPPNEGTERKFKKALQQTKCCERLFASIEEYEHHNRSYTKQRSKSQIEEGKEEAVDPNTVPLSLAISPK